MLCFQKFVERTDVISGSKAQVHSLKDSWSWTMGSLDDHFPLQTGCELHFHVSSSQSSVTHELNTNPSYDWVHPVFKNLLKEKDLGSTSSTIDNGT